MKFTDRYVAKLQPQEKRFEVLEGNGFTLRVAPSGIKSFYYVYKADGKNHRLHLGEYPHVSLAEARDKHLAALRQRKRGENPVEARREADRAREAALSVEALAKEYLERHAKPNKRSWKLDEAILKNDVLPAWGERKASDIRKRDVILLLEKIVDRGAPNQSTQTLKVVRKMFNFAVERDLLESSPCHLVKPLTKPTSKERVLSAEEIRLFWHSLDLEETRISSAMRRGLKLILATGQRPGECLGMMTDELDGEWWTIPATRSKNGREHRVYLTPMSRELFGEVKSGPVFPGPTTTGQKPAPMDKAAPAKAVRRLFAKTSRRNPRLQIPPFTPHDLRRTCATHLGSLGYDNEQIGRLLNHVDSRVTAIYNRHRYDDLIREMLTAWERRLREILVLTPPRLDR